jgi:hypothetical protein
MLLSTDIWVGALIRRAELGGAFATVARKGDPRAGAVLVKAVDRRANTAKLYSEATRGDGERFWMQPVRSDFEPDLDAYAERAARIDPDIWVVEIEDRDGRHFLTEPVEGTRSEKRTSVKANHGCHPRKARGACPGPRGRCTASPVP